MPAYSAKTTVGWRIKYAKAGEKGHSVASFSLAFACLMLGGGCLKEIISKIFFKSMLFVGVAIDRFLSTFIFLNTLCREHRL